MIQPTLSSENVLFHARHDHTKAYVPSQTEAREERESGRLRMQALLRFKRKGSFFASSRIPPFEQRIPGKPFGCGRNR